MVVVLWPADNVTFKLSCSSRYNLKSLLVIMSGKVVSFRSALSSEWTIFWCV